MKIKFELHTSSSHALQRTAAGRRGCNRRASWPPLLSLGRYVFTILLVVVVAGCSRLAEYSAPREGFACVLHEREVVLTTEHPEDDFLKAKLVSIAEDGRTRIKVLASGETLESSVGSYFVGTNAYGLRGLYLVSASRQKGEARFLRTRSEGK
jgi:hypothetical protein